MKHAYLIIAHSSFELLQELVSALDDVRNDIYIHLDSKFSFDESLLRTEHSQLFILPVRLDARWGDFSLVRIEFMLFEKASQNGPYKYYHLLSGVDFPLKSQDYIHAFFENNQGLEFIGFAQQTSEKEINWRSQHYFLFPRSFQSKNIFKKVIRAIYARLQSLVGYKRIAIEVKKGCQWCSITHDFVVYMLEKKQFIYDSFNHTYCPDEMFIQTLCWNSPFKERVYDINDEFNGCKRYIMWKDSVIQVLDNIDVDTLVNSDRLFARKFTINGINLVKSISRAYVNVLNRL